MARSLVEQRERTARRRTWARIGLVLSILLIVVVVAATVWASVIAGHLFLLVGAMVDPELVGEDVPGWRMATWLFLDRRVQLVLAALVATAAVLGRASRRR